MKGTLTCRGRKIRSKLQSAADDSDSECSDTRLQLNDLSFEIRQSSVTQSDLIRINSCSKIYERRTYLQREKNQQ